MTKPLNKTKIYLDTSVISYLEQTDAPYQMQITRDVWEILKSGKYDVYISDVVVKELSKCSDEQKRRILLSHLEEIDYKIVKVTEEAFSLAERIVDFGILKKRSFDDCQHIAAAIIGNCEVIMSWNFKHIVNLDTMKGLKVLTTIEGYKDILIYSPEIFQIDKEDEND
ncbi:MAG: PIN domain-containing protein [Spirochaetales bacterium]|nr:PIN domain-containing protein [Spirochaetales bacterium]